MKAFVLAAGLGTRLRPLTDDRPKVMLEVGGKKILERTIEQLKNAGINNLVINLHYFPEAVSSYFGDGSKWGVKIVYSKEPSILGTAGGLKNVEKYFKGEKEFLVVYGDNAYNVDFHKFINQPFIAGAESLIMLFDRNKSLNSGAAGGVVNVSGSYIEGFYEGADHPEINYVNAAVYKFTPKIFEEIPENKFYDFGKDVFPKMLSEGKKLQAFIINKEEAVFGVDSPEYLEKANKYFKNL